MDLRCGCCGGELGYAEWNLLQEAPKDEVIIFSCRQCRCGYDTSAARTHMCERFGINRFVFKSGKESIQSSSKDTGSASKRRGGWLKPTGHFILQPPKQAERYGRERKADGMSIGNLLFDFLFGR